MLMEDGSVTNVIWEVHSCILFQRAARGSMINYQTGPCSYRSNVFLIKTVRISFWMRCVFIQFLFERRQTRISVSDNFA